jgi:hypothetical protein
MNKPAHQDETMRARGPKAGGKESMASVEIRDVRNTFGVTQIIHGVSVEIQDREFNIHLTLATGNAPIASLVRQTYDGIRPGPFRLRGDGIPADEVVVKETGQRL